MGLIDKIKNALFEEEYVEVEEKPKTKAKPKREKPKKESNKDTKPIAKKIVLSNKEDDHKTSDVISKIDYEDPIDEDFDVEPLTNNKEKNEFKFPVIDDKDLKVENESYLKNEPEIVRVIEDEYSYEKEATKPYNGKKHLYGIDEDNKISVHEYGSYEKKEERKVFKPSPIISPIYGVLDKNYKKEEIVSKKEVRLTSSYAREKISVDDVRNKAYGTLVDDIAREIEEDIKPKVTNDHDSVEEDQGNVLVDLSSDSKKPEVHEVTMGDALEYFQDLGLEYNVDYKDASKEKAAGKHIKEDSSEDKVDIEEDTKDSVSNNHVDSDVLEKDSDDENDDNLFDLIDSMYEEENKE